MDGRQYKDVFGMDTPPVEGFIRALPELRQGELFNNLTEGVEFHEKAMEIYRDCFVYDLDPVEVFGVVGSRWKEIHSGSPSVASRYLRAVPAIMRSMGDRRDQICATLNRLGEYANLLGDEFLDVSFGSGFCASRVPSPLDLLEYRAEVCSMSGKPRWAMV